MKVSNIPIYIRAFLIGFSYFFLPAGLVVTIGMIALNYPLLFSTSMYAVSGLLKARSERKIKHNGLYFMVDYEQL